MEKLIIESKYAIFEFQESDKKLMTSLAEYLDKKAMKIYKFFQIEPKQKAIFSIIPTKSEFDDIYYKYKKLNPATWIVGTTLKDNQIILLSYNDYVNNEIHNKDTFDHYKKTVVHEFVHFVNKLFTKENKCEYAEKFLSEGIATYLSEQYNISSQIKSSLNDILQKRTNNYIDFKLLVKYLVENYDKEFVLSLFKSKQKANAFLKQELYNKSKKYYQKLIYDLQEK